jgi:hypothetical protein
MLAGLGARVQNLARGGTSKPYDTSVSSVEKVIASDLRQVKGLMLAAGTSGIEPESRQARLDI